MPDFKFSLYAVAYLDILGFSSFVKEAENNDEKRDRLGVVSQ